MKKKSRFLVHIALIALSLCIMVYGVYAAKSASLTVSGTIGFTAHNGSVEVQLTGISGAYDIYHNEVVMKDATTGQVVLDTTSTTAVTAGSSATNLAIKTATIKQTDDNNTYSNGELNALYFDDVESSTATQDVITDIVFTFTATNKALFAMKLDETKFNGNAVTGNTRVTYTIALGQGVTNNSMNEGTKGSNDTVTGGGTLTFTITLKLANATTGATTMENLSASAFSIPVEFIKA